MESIQNSFFLGADLSDKKITWAAWDKELEYGYLPFGHVIVFKPKLGLVLSYEMEEYRVVVGLVLSYEMGRGVSGCGGLVGGAVTLVYDMKLDFLTLNDVAYHLEDDPGICAMFVSNDGSLWSRVIQALYGPTIDSHSVHMASNWYAILRELQLLKSKGLDFLAHCNKRIGDGRDTRFWFDIWKGDKSFREDFPGLFALETDKKICVAEKIVLPIDSTFRRSVRGGTEQNQLSSLESFMETVSLSAVRDRWLCNLSWKGNFCVRDIHNYIDDMILPAYHEPTRWVKCVPIKINIFAWRARRDCLPTTCPFCLSCEEDARHIFFRCDLVQAVLRRVCRWWELDWQPWASFSDWQLWFSSIRLPFKVKCLFE
nr:RNA-directed DNA polymerase, eukaryota [Tanacetum cinerariifolium]